MSVIREGEDLILQLRYTERVGAFDLGPSAAQKAFFFLDWVHLLHSSRQPAWLRCESSLYNYWMCSVQASLMSVSLFHCTGQLRGLCGGGVCNDCGCVCFQLCITCKGGFVFKCIWLVWVWLFSSLCCSLHRLCGCICFTAVDVCKHCGCVCFQVHWPVLVR